MKVNTDKPFEIVFSLAKHPFLGWLIEAHAVQLGSKGQYTLTHQKIRLVNADPFKLNDKEKEALALIEETEVDVIMEKFLSNSKGLRTSVYFSKYFKEEDFKTKIRPYIDQRLSAALNIIKDLGLWLSGPDDNPTYIYLTIEQMPVAVHYHFIKKEDFRYFIIIRNGAEMIKPFNAKSTLITENKPWMLCNDKVFYFGPEVDGKKLIPFLKKPYISIPEKVLGSYLKTFVKPLLEKTHVTLSGVELIKEKHKAKAILRLSEIWDGKFYLSLFFKYSKETFSYNKLKNVHISLEEEKGEFVFKQIARSTSWEENKRSFIESQGLKHIENNLFLPEDNLKSGNAIVLLQWLSEFKDALENEGFTIQLEGELDRYVINTPNIDFKVNEGQDWFDLKINIEVGEYKIPFAKLKNNIVGGNPIYELPDGKIFVIPIEWFAQLTDLIKLSTHENEIMKVRRIHFTLLDSLMNAHARTENLVPVEKYKLSKIIPEYEISDKFTGTLRPYQKEGFDWLMYLAENKYGACLADDMGLGKTAQTICALTRLHEIQENLNEELEHEAADGEVQILTAKKPLSLIVMPTSLLYNWLAEFKKFAPHLKVLVYQGPRRKKWAIEDMLQYDILLTSYGTVRRDLEILFQLDIKCLILDESQAIKNPYAQSTKTVSRLKARHRIVMTGTPIENSLSDLWSQMNFINPNILGSFNQFRKDFLLPIEKKGDQKRKKQLRKLVQPYMMRRTKEEVATDLPPKMEQVYFCDMEEEQLKLYDEIKSSYRNDMLFDLGFKGKNNFKILSGLMKLRLISNHPKLSDPEYSGKSGKFEQIKYIIEKLLKSGKKMLLFSQFVRHLTLYREWLDENDVPYYYIDGSTNPLHRKEYETKFNTSKTHHIALVSLRAAGIGLNFIGADYVLLADPWWNPAVEAQAIDRAHRIGRVGTVVAYRFIAKGSIEEKIQKLQSRKNKLSSDILSTEETFFKNLEKDDLKDLFD